MRSRSCVPRVAVRFREGFGQVQGHYGVQCSGTRFLSCKLYDYGGYGGQIGAKITTSEFRQPQRIWVIPQKFWSAPRLRVFLGPTAFPQSFSCTYKSPQYTNSIPNRTSKSTALRNFAHGRALRVFFRLLSGLPRLPAPARFTGRPSIEINTQVWIDPIWQCYILHCGQ